jgi:ABC-type sugar transport system ATPase subunit
MMANKNLESKEFILVANGIKKSFPGVIALDNIQFNLKRGEVHTVIGENGAGKSTLMKILAGVYKKDDGSIKLNGEEVNIESPKQALSLGINTIFQELNSLPNLTVMQNVFLGREPKTNFCFVDKKKLYVKTEEIMKQLNLDIEPDTIVGELSVGKQQMVEVAKAVFFACQIIIMDEPTAVLSKQERDVLFTTIKTLKERNVSIIYISHRIEEILEISDRITVLRDGKYIGTIGINEATAEKIVKMMVGRELTEYYPKVCGEKGEVAIAVKNISKKELYKNVSFEARYGEVLGFYGLVGAGRTEVANSIFGMILPDMGEILINNIKVNIKSPRDAIRLGLGYVPEDRKLIGLIINMAVQENMTLARLPWLSRFGFINRMEQEKTTNYYIKKLGIKCSNNKQIVNTLSGGNQQKVVLAKWLTLKPKVLILDEPTRGIDVKAKVEIYSIINDLIKEGIAIIFISSDLSEVINMSDRIIVMRDGSISGEFNRGSFSQEKIIECAILEKVNG